MSPDASRAVQNAVTDAAQKSLSAGYQRSFLDNKDNGRALAALETQVSKDPTLDENRIMAVSTLRRDGAPHTHPLGVGAGP